MELLTPDDAPDDARYRNLNLVLGTNGAGKSTVLKAAALGLLTPLFQMGAPFPRPFWVRRTQHGSADGAHVHVDLRLHAVDRAGARPEDERIELCSVDVTVIPVDGGDELIQVDNVDPIWAPIHEFNASFFVAAYGASRRVGPDRQALARFDRVGTLFDESRGLVPLDAALPRIAARSAERFEALVDLLDRLLPDGTTLERDATRAGNVAFIHRGLSTPYGALSDGYQAYLAWMGDLLVQLEATCPTGHALESLEGVVLIDEVDSHLHPGWQLDLLPTLAACLPRIQFICTTHSPFVVGSVEACNVHVLEGESAAVIRPMDEELFGLSSDQIVTGAAFGLPSSRARSFVSEIERVEREAIDDPAAALRFAQMLAHGGAETAMPPGAPPDWVARLTNRKGRE
ncbi:MAG: AAA family ATPase [Planctomycetota bacterium]